MNIWSFLAAAVGPLALRVIAALSLSVVTFTGVDTALSGLITMAQSNWSGMGADVLQLCSIARIPECFGLIAGSMSARVTAWVASSAARWVTK